MVFIMLSDTDLLFGLYLLHAPCSPIQFKPQVIEGVLKAPDISWYLAFLSQDFVSSSHHLHSRMKYKLVNNPMGWEIPGGKYRYLPVNTALLILMKIGNTGKYFKNLFF